MQVKDLIEHLKTYNPDTHVAAHIWSVADVLTAAKEMKIKINKDEAIKIIDNINEHIDCELGITWETIRCGIEEYKNE